MYFKYYTVHCVVLCIVWYFVLYILYCIVRIGL